MISIIKNVTSNFLSYSGMKLSLLKHNCMYSDTLGSLIKYR